MPLPQDVFTTRQGGYQPWFNQVQQTSIITQPAAADGTYGPNPFSVSIPVIGNQGPFRWAVGMDWFGAFTAINAAIMFSLSGLPLITYPLILGPGGSFQATGAFIYSSQKTATFGSSSDFYETDQNPMVTFATQQTQTPPGDNPEWNYHTVPTFETGGFNCDRLTFSGNMFFSPTSAPVPTTFPFYTQTPSLCAFQL